MSCSPFDLKDYLLDELGASERRQMERHFASCGACRDEMERLRLTETALRSLADEEIPQRIAFVSDKVFEPSPLRRGWQAFWASSSRLAFAASAMLSVALIVSALTRPAPAPVRVSAPPIDMARLESQFSQRMSDAVSKAVSESETRQARKTAELIQAIEKRNEFERRGLIVAMDENIKVFQQRMNRLIHVSNDLAADLERTQ